MIKIAIIDDEKEMRDAITGYIREGTDMDNSIEIDAFASSEIFLDKVEKGLVYDILFSDIELAGMNGMELGRILAEKMPKLILIFVTSYSEFATESYVIEAYQYILKRDMADRIPEVTARIVKKLQREKTRHIIIGTESKREKLLCANIIYLSKVSKYVEYHTADGIYRERISLNQALEKLKGNEFIQIEKGIVVNMKHITKIEGNSIYLSEKNHVIVSRARLTKVKQQINYYWGNEE